MLPFELDLQYEQANIKLTFHHFSFAHDQLQLLVFILKK